MDPFSTSRAVPSMISPDRPAVSRLVSALAIPFGRFAAAFARLAPATVMIAACTHSAAAQVALAPAGVEPAAFERLALRVANPDPSPVVRVRLEVPNAFTVLGVEAPPGWTWRRTPATDTSATVIEWAGDSLQTGSFREFAVFARLESDALPLTLVFPARVTHADGRVVTWDRDGDAPPPTMEIRGTTLVSAAGAVALAGGAIGLAALALVLALYRRRT